MPVATILSTVSDDLRIVEERLQKVVEVEYPLLSALLRHVITPGGKRLRPALVLLAAKFHDYDLERLIPVALAIELLHTATLVHDDLIDNASTRRGAATLNTVISGKATILVGDYLFARAAGFATGGQSVRVMEIFSDALMKICDGELRNIFGSGDMEQTRRDYYRKIESKTAALFVAATECGAILSRAPEAEIAALSSYGYKLGVAFQIIDDILDFIGDERKMGKPVGSDLRQGTVTLPAIYLLESRPDDGELRRLFASDGDDPAHDDNIKRLVEMIAKSSAIGAAQREAQTFIQEAKEALSILPDNEYRRALMDIADYVIERKN